jgi:transglutaminase-like putative cysteine protease
MPGAGSAGVLDPRTLRDGDSARKTISPLVDIRTRLVNQADVEVFTVRSPKPSYWRITSLERFDGRIWSSSGSYGSVDGELPRGVEADVATETFEQTFTVNALAAIWLPAAYEPRALAIEGGEVRYDEESATLIVDNEVPTSDGLVYRVTSASPRLDGLDLAAAGDIPDEISDRYLDLPDGFSPRVRELAQALVTPALTPYEQARAIQDHLRTFQYDLEIGPGHSDNALESFLFDTRRGYCEQFAGAFAAMARAVGLPARVSVGFTQGETTPADPELYRVRGEHAHAWPEVYLAGAGWVAFEPTPGRGMPFAESYTGVQPAQAATNDPGSVVTTPPTTAGDTIPTAPNGDTSPRNPDAGLDTGGVPTGGGAPARPDPVALRYLWRPLVAAVPVVAGLAVVYLLAVPLAMLVRWWSRRRRARTPEERIGLAWTESVEHASVVGYRERRADTFQERASALAAALPDAAGDAARLAHHLEVARYSAAGADDGAAEDAASAASRVGHAARAQASRWARIRRWLDLRPLVDPWRTKRAAAHRRITTTARADLEVERGLVS